MCLSTYKCQQNIYSLGGCHGLQQLSNSVPAVYCTQNVALGFLNRWKLESNAQFILLCKTLKVISAKEQGFTAKSPFIK